MTVIIGIICKASIVLASDSQTTYGDSKRRDAEKIRVVSFKKSKVLVAQSGAVDTSSRVIDVMTRLANDRVLDSEETVIRTAQEAMREVRQELRHQHFDCSAEELRELIWKEGLDCSFMVAHFFANSPFIHTFSFQAGTTNSSKSCYESIGCGSSLANYILGDLCTSDMEPRLGQTVAVYAVDKVIDNVNGCDRPIRLALIYPWEPYWIPAPSSISAVLGRSLRTKQLFIDSVDLVSAKIVEEITAKVSTIDKETQQQRTEKLRMGLFNFADTLPFPDYSNLKESE